MPLTCSFANVFWCAEKALLSRSGYLMAVGRTACCPNPYTSDDSSLPLPKRGKLLTGASWTLPRNLQLLATEPKTKDPKAVIEKNNAVRSNLRALEEGWKELDAAYQAEKNKRRVRLTPLLHPCRILVAIAGISCCTRVAILRNGKPPRMPLPPPNDVLVRAPCSSV